MAAVSLPAFSQVDIAILEHSSPLPSLTEKGWENPALISEKFINPLTSISGSFFNSSSERYGEFRASTYLKLKDITIQGHAQYDNGARHNVRFCENVDISKVYPYVTYDAVGGNLNLERYAFGGAVDVKVGKDWNAGGRLSYNAGLYYRNVDPRPRDVSGVLDIAAGGAYTLPINYKLALCARYQKYKQSCDITFMNELGETKIYHLTGLGSHYSRFAGLGHNTYYSGHSIGGSVTLLPLSSGAYVNIGGDLEKMSQILSDLNKLPLTRLDSRYADIELGWKENTWGITAFGSIYRRHGYENIFGDAATGQYPQIASLGMHIINHHEIGIRTAAEMNFGKVSLSLMPEIKYSHYAESHREPDRSVSIDNFYGGTDAQFDWIISPRLIFRSQIGYRAIPCLKGSISGLTTDNPDLLPFVDIFNNGFNEAASTRSHAQVEIGGDYIFGNKKYALSLDISYEYTTGAGSETKFTFSFKF